MPRLTQLVCGRVSMQVCLSPKFLRGTAPGSPGDSCTPSPVPLGLLSSHPYLPCPLHTVREGRGEHLGTHAGSAWAHCTLRTRLCLCAIRLAGRRLAWCGTWGRQTLPRASGVAWSWMSPLGRTMVRWRAPGMVDFPRGAWEGPLSLGREWELGHLKKGV